MINYPDNYYFTREREWINFIDTDIAYIGLTQLAIKELEPINNIEIHTVGQPLEQNQVFGRVRNETTLCKLIMPFDGLIIEANNSYTSNLEAINGEYSYDNWIVKVKLILPIDKNNLFSLDAYKAHKTDKIFHLITYLLPGNVR